MQVAKSAYNVLAEKFVAFIYLSDFFRESGVRNERAGATFAEFCGRRWSASVLRLPQARGLPCLHLHAHQIWLVGDFNNWEKALPMVKNSYGVWKTATADARPGQLYKFLVKQADDKEVMKFDSVALEYEPRLGYAAVISDLPIKHWTDGAWFGWHERSNHFARPINNYEVHVNSWKQHEAGSLYTLKDLQRELIPYVKVNYIEFLPLTAHPLDASWGRRLATLP